MKKTASAVWKGDLKSGQGTISSQSGALKNQPYGFNTRFADQPGTNLKSCWAPRTRAAFRWRCPISWARQA